MRSPNAADYCIGVVGAGAMGQGIAQVAVQGGIRTLILDAREGAAEAAREQVAARIARLVEKGRMGQDEADTTTALLEPVTATRDLAPCDAVVEAVSEDLEVKRTLFRDIEASVSADCLIASNTSSIPIASIAWACDRRGRIGGLHFFNPVPLMRLVEVIRAAETMGATVEALAALGRRMARTPVTVKDSPGFLVNMGGRAFTTEGTRLAHEGIATPAQIDAIMRDCHGFRMGPFELMDLTGIDVNYPVSLIVWEGYGYDPRIRPSPNHKAMFDAGLHGRKTGRGWFGYDGTKPADVPSPDHETQAAPAQGVSVLEPSDDGGTAGDLHGFLNEIGLEVVEDDGTCPLVAAPIGSDATSVALSSGRDPARVVCLDLSGDTGARVTLMTPPGADRRARDAVAAAICASGRKVTVVRDSPGFVGQRMCAMIANLGCYMAEIGLAEPEDIDTALKLGLNYPRGPLELADFMTPQAVLQVLDAAQEITGDDRYRPTPWLMRRAALGLPIHTPG